MGCRNLIQRNLCFRTEFLQKSGNRPIPLGRFHIQPLTADAAANRACNEPERRITPIPLCIAHPRAMVFLPTGDAPAAFGFRYRNAKGFQRFQRHINIALGFDFCCQANFAFALQQGQRKQQPCDKLGADIPRQGIYAASQLALQRNGKVVAVCLTAMPCHLIQQNANRAFGESPLAFKAAVLSQCARNREQKTKGGAAFAAVKDTQLSIYLSNTLSICLSNPILWTGEWTGNRHHINARRLTLNFRAKALQTACRRFHILRPAIHEQHAFLLRQCRRNQRAVPIGFRGNDTHLPLF